MILPLHEVFVNPFLFFENTNSETNNEYVFNIYETHTKLIIDIQDFALQNIAHFKSIDTINRRSKCWLLTMYQVLFQCLSVTMLA